MKDESTGNRYLRAVGKKGVEDMERLVKDLHEELKSRGRTGGAGGNMIIKIDGEASIVALRDALSRYHGELLHQKCHLLEKARRMAQRKTTAEECEVLLKFTRTNWRNELW